MLRSIFLLVFAGCVAPATPDVAANDAASERANVPECAVTVRTTLLVRFWRGREELPCAEALAGGLRVTVGPQGSASGWSDAPEYVCEDTLNADPSRRQLSGIYTYDQPGTSIWAARVEDAAGDPVTADSTVYFDVPTCARGVHYQFVTFALPPE